MVGVDDGAPMARGKTWRWGLYAISLAFAFSELIAGLIAQQKDEWVLPWVLYVDIPPLPKKRASLLTLGSDHSSYALWTLIFVMFTWSCYRASPRRFVVYAKYP